jgi:O-antigen/teichoic acid export membrane protein
MNSCGKNKAILMCSVLSLLLNVILNPLLYLVLGMVGPAIATFLSVLAVQMIQLIFTARLTDIPFSKIFPWKDISLITVWNAVLGILFYSIKAILPLDQICGSIPEALFLSVVWGAAYLLLMKRRITSFWNLLNDKDS